MRVFYWLQRKKIITKTNLEICYSPTNLSYTTLFFSPTFLAPLFRPSFFSCNFFDPSFSHKFFGPTFLTFFSAFLFWPYFFCIDFLNLLSSPILSTEKKRLSSNYKFSLFLIHIVIFLSAQCVSHTLTLSMSISHCVCDSFTSSHNVCLSLSLDMLL
jgi:hypothetical protein